MSTNSTTSAVGAEQIDLLQLLEHCILFLRRYFRLFCIAAILGLITGFIVYKWLPRNYKSTLILHSFLLTNPEEIAIADNWNTLLHKKEYTALSKLLNCPDTLLKKVWKIDAAEVQKVFTPVNPNGFSIEVTVTDNRVLPQLQEAIVYGYEHCTYVKERLDMKKERLRNLISFTQQEIGKLDTAKHSLEAILQGRGHAGQAVILDGSSIYKQSIELQEKLAGQQEELAFTAAVQLIQPFEAFEQPAGPRKFIWLGAGLAGFLALAWCYAFTDSIRRKWKARQSEISR
jgi:hypothetical protein